jgi:uncharacterized protein YcbK (DUF882 family)
VLVGKARRLSAYSVAVRTGYCAGIAALFLLIGSRGLQNAVAEGDTRTISMHHIHTDEDITITYKRNGRYDEDALKKINWFLRDWRKEAEIKMDPHLIDLVWEVQREVGAKEPIWVVCGYRSPATNSMLRRRSRGVAKFSQHMLGHAMDFYIPGASLEQIRIAGLRLQRGGVGFYPTSGSPFVHLDTGSVRHWPRMTHDQLVKVFPNGRTVHIPSDGHPLAGYQLALADISKHGGTPSGPSLEAAREAGVNIASADRPTQNPFAKLFGLGSKSDEDEDADTAAPATTAAAEPTPAAPRAKAAKPTVVAALERSAEKEKTATKPGKAEIKPDKKTPATAAHEQAKTAPIRVAAATMTATPVRISSIPVAPARPAQAASLAVKSPSANDVIAQRGFWQGLPDGMIAAQPASGDATTGSSGTARTHRMETASADPDLTGTLSPWAKGSEDRVSPDLALAYAAQPAQEPTSRAMAPMGSRAGSASSRAVTAKRAASRTSIPHVQSLPAVSGVATHHNNPWMRAVVMSPSVHEYLTITMLGPHDFRGLEPMMRKPESSVMMTFSADPMLGLEHEHFSGSAVVFVSTVTYSSRTASLQ